MIERLFILCEYILNEQFYKNASGAVCVTNVRSLKGKTGEKPARSRHCNGEQLINHCFMLKWEGIRSDEPKSGDLPVVCT